MIFSMVLSAYQNKSKCFFEGQPIIKSDIQLFTFLPLFLSNLPLTLDNSENQKLK